MSSKLFLSCAGSGKTRLIIQKALEISNKEKILITTYTINNCEQIKNKIFEMNKGVFPKNIHVKPWFTFLLEDGVRPYKYKNYLDKIEGMKLVSGPSKNFIKEENVKYFYFNNNNEIFSDKIAMFIIKNNQWNGNKIISRLKKIYKNIFIDEVQDMSGYDLDIINLFKKELFNLILVGDIRQMTYKTNLNIKNKKYNNDLESFFKKNEFEIDYSTLNKTYRNVQSICDFASKIHNFKYENKIFSKNNENIEHSGIFLVDESNKNYYLEKYAPIQLIYDKKEKRINKNYKFFNFGSSKGLEFDRVLIYPTSAIKKWLINGDESELKYISKNKLYVAVTRAKYSVAFLWDNKNNKNFFNLPIFNIEKHEEDKNEE